MSGICTQQRAAMQPYRQPQDLRERTLEPLPREVKAATVCVAQIEACTQSELCFTTPSLHYECHAFSLIPSILRSTEFDEASERVIKITTIPSVH